MENLRVDPREDPRHEPGAPDGGATDTGSPCGDANAPDLRVRRAKEEEHRRLAQILHDDIQQRLYSLRTRLFAARDAARRGERSPSALADELDAVDALLLDAILATRRLTHGAASEPDIATDAAATPLQDAMVDLGAQMRALHGLDVEITCSDRGAEVSGDVMAGVTHVLRELLFNVVKHAGVPRAQVRASVLRDLLVIEVIDEGRGFAAAVGGERTAAFGGFGLHDARGRLRRLGGDMSVESAPGAGTCVRIRVPTTRPA